MSTVLAIPGHRYRVETRRGRPRHGYCSEVDAAYVWWVEDDVAYAVPFACPAWDAWVATGAITDMGSLVPEGRGA